MSHSDAVNEPQREAIGHDEGPLLILAGAGSGKTRVITFRIARLLQQGVPPWQIFAVTFTNKAAEEMRTRVRELVGADPRGAWISTFHSASARLIREQPERVRSLCEEHSVSPNRCPTSGWRPGCSAAG